MAKIRSGILGNIRGKVAGVVGSQWKNVNYLREFVKPANPNTSAQQVQRGKMSDIVAFCKTLVGPVFNAYTDKFQKAMSGFNFFIKGAIVEFDGTPVYGNLKLTEGKLQVIDVLLAVYNAGPGNVTITWTGALGNNGADDDKVFAAIHNTVDGLWYFPAAEVDRSVDSIVVPTSTAYNAGDIECWVWAIDYQGTIVNIISDSVQLQSTAP